MYVINDLDLKKKVKIRFKQRETIFQRVPYVDVDTAPRNRLARFHAFYLTAYKAYILEAVRWLCSRDNRLKCT